MTAPTELRAPRAEGSRALSSRHTSQTSWLSSQPFIDIWAKPDKPASRPNPGMTCVSPKETAHDQAMYHPAVGSYHIQGSHHNRRRAVTPAGISTLNIPAPAKPGAGFIHLSNPRASGASVALRDNRKDRRTYSAGSHDGRGRTGPRSQLYRTLLRFHPGLEREGAGCAVLSRRGPCRPQDVWMGGQRTGCHQPRRDYSPRFRCLSFQAPVPGR